jgi:CHAD domain-containing protein
VLPLLGVTGESARRLQRTVRRITRALGPVRELDVALGNLRELQGRRGVPPAAVTQLREGLEAERASLQKGVRKTIEKCKTRRLRARAVRVARRASTLSESAGARRREIAWRHAGARGRWLRATIGRTGDSYLPDRLHEVRIAVKKLRYALEAVTEITSDRPPAGMTRLTQAQDLLGRLHDLQVLIARTRDWRALPGGAEPARPADLVRLADRLDGECRRLHARFIGVRPGLLAVCDRTDRMARRGEGG